MRRPTKRDLEEQLSRLRGGSDPAEAEAFEDKCRAWLNSVSNRDGRGIKAEAIKSAYWTCLWFKQAQGAASHEDSTVRRLARKALKGTRHQCFPQIRKNLSKLHGRISKAGKRIADQRRRSAERTVQLDDRFSLQEMRSMESLQQAGRALRNCTAKESFARQYLNDDDAEMWALLDWGRPHCLLRVSLRTREIDEVEGEDGTSPKLKRSVALKILNELQITGDDQKTFARIGAFEVFRHGQPSVRPVVAGDHRHWIWVLRNGAEIVVASELRHGKRKRWSRFSRRGRGAQGRKCGPRLRRRSSIEGGLWNYLSEGDLLGLVLEHPPLAEELRRPDSSCVAEDVDQSERSEATVGKMGMDRMVPDANPMERDHA